MFRMLSNKTGLNAESVEVLMNDAYIQGLEDMKDTLLFFCSSIGISDMDATQIRDALTKFIKRMESEIREYKDEIIECKFPSVFNLTETIKEKSNQHQ